MQSQHPPFWEWPLDRLNGLLLTGALVLLLLLSVVNYAVQRQAALLALATPTPAVVQTAAPAQQTAAPQETATVAPALTPTMPLNDIALAIIAPRHGSQFPAPLARIEGRAPAGATVLVFDNNRRLGQALAGPDGNWALDLAAPLTEGDHLLRAQASDAQHQALGRSSPVLVTILAPQPPTIDAPTASTRLTAKTPPTISGSAMPSSLIRIWVDQRTVGETTSNNRGAWQFTLTKPLARGQHRLRADLISPNGNVLLSSAEATITVAP